MDFWPKKGQNLHVWPNIEISGPFDPMPDQKTMQTRCLGGFLIFGYQNFCSLPKLFGFWAQIWHFWPNICIFGQILAFLARLMPCWLVVVARTVSRKTPIYFITLICVLE